eukprot:261418-Pelagomonas_calceolata.AAC.3
MKLSSVTKTTYPYDENPMMNALSFCAHACTQGRVQKNDAPSFDKCNGRVQEKLRQSRAAEQSRLSFGKSELHGRHRSVSIARIATLTSSQPPPCHNSHTRIARHHDLTHLHTHCASCPVNTLAAFCLLTGIHGWGIFALRSIPQDSLVAEYRGEIVRNSMADLREMQYREGGQDCYLFRVRVL